MDRTAQALPVGTRVRLHDDTGENGPVRWGTVVDPTDDEQHSPDHLDGIALDPAFEVFVEWSPTYRRNEYVEDLRTR